MTGELAAAEDQAEHAGARSVPARANPSHHRLIRKLRDALGEAICRGLDDTSVVEIMVNPDGRLFVERLGQGMVMLDALDPGAAEIVQAVIGIARTYGLGVIAEGVETRAQELTLRALGCAEAQGFRYGRPMPAAELLDAWRNPPAPRRTAARA